MKSRMAARNNYISWDECFMRMAEIIAERSKDPSTQAGAAIVTQDNIVLGIGYNGWPRGIDDEHLPWDRDGELHETKYAYVCHAEENAVYNSNNSTRGGKIYCTLFPCNECAKTIIQNGITEVIYQSDKYQDTPSVLASKKLFELAGIKLRQYQTVQKK